MYVSLPGLFSGLLKMSCLLLGWQSNWLITVFSMKIQNDPQYVCIELPERNL